MKEKVYCSECEYFKDHYSAVGLLTCESPKNKKNKISKGTWRERPREGIIYTISPQHKNQYNDCKWFKRQELPF